MPHPDEPTAALTSRTAVVAALLMLGAIMAMVVVWQVRDPDDGAPAASGPVVEQSRKPVTDSGAQWPMLPDSGDSTWPDYGGVGRPTSYFVDAAGMAQRVHIGPVTEEQRATHRPAIGVGAEPPAASAAA